MSILALMRRFTIRLRMQGAIGAVLLLLGLLGGAGMWGMLRIHAVNQDFFVGPYAQSEASGPGVGPLGPGALGRQKELLLQLTQHHALERAYADWQTSLQQLEQQAVLTSSCSCTHPSLMQLPCARPLEAWRWHRVRPGAHPSALLALG